MSTAWHEPVVSVIHLANGQTTEAEVNGRDLEGTSGHAYVQGCEIVVARLAKSDEWEEVCA